MEKHLWYAAGNGAIDVIREILKLITLQSVLD